MRYFRFVANPLSPVVNNGSVELRLQMLMSQQMIFRNFSDGEWFAIDDQEMGTFGVHLDFLTDDDGPDGPYKFFQEGAFETIPVLATIVVMNTLLVPTNLL